MVQLKINFKKKDLFLVFAIGIFIVGIGYVMAYNWQTGSGTGKAALNGHTADEIDGAVGGAINAVQAVGTTDISSQTAEADMPDMSITLTTSGTKILTMFSAPMWVTINGEWGYVNLYIDDVLKRKQFVSMYAYDDSVSFQHLETGLTPGSHTVKLKWYSGTAGGLRQQGASHSPRTLTVVDLAGNGGSGACSNTPITPLGNGVVYLNNGPHKLMVTAWLAASSAAEDIEGWIKPSTTTTWPTYPISSDSSATTAAARSSISFVVPVGYNYKVSTTSTGLFTAEAWEMC